MEEKLNYPNIEKCDPYTCISGSIMKSNRIIANILRKHLKSFQVTDSQLSILLVVTKINATNQKKVSDLLFMEKSTVNRNISRLLKQQYISLDKNLFLHTTESGKQFLEQVIPHWILAMDEMREILGKEGTEAVHKIMRQLTK